MTVTKVMNIIEQYLMAQGYEYRRLDGSMPEAKRVQLVKEFNRDASLFIFLISTKWVDMIDVVLWLCGYAVVCVVTIALSELLAYVVIWERLGSFKFTV